MIKYYINKKTIFFNMILVYPLINIIVCTLFKGDNMIIFSLIYCLLLVLLYITEFRKISISSLITFAILMFILVLEIGRDTHMISLYAAFIVTNIMLCIYSSDKISITEYINFFVNKKISFYNIQVFYFAILILYVAKNGLRAGWNTWVLQGPYNYPHTLAYILCFMLMLDAFFFIEFKDRIAFVFILLNLISIFLTAVRSVLLVAIIVLVFIFFRMLSKKQFFKLIFYVVLTVIGLLLAYKHGIFNALLAKNRLAISHGSLSNGRNNIASSSIKAITKGNIYINILGGIGMTNLLKWNGININASIHAHNDFIDAIVCYGICGFGIYVYNFLKFSKYKYIWILGTLVLLAYGNGLYVYIDVIPLIIYARILFSYNELLHMENNNK